MFSVAKFQFHKGTIKAGVIAERCNYTSIFQFHKGTIKALVNRLATSSVYNFNSIKVQLKHEAKEYQSDHISFQFHKGTIKAVTASAAAGVLVLFQFHKGTIKAYSFMLQVFSQFIFQFHKGTIKAFLRR